MRLPLASDLISRDGTTAKDARVQNGIIEVDGDSSNILRRPGTSNISTLGSGTAQSLNRNNTAVIGDSLVVFGSSGSVVSTTSISPMSTGEMYSSEFAKESSNTEPMMFKNGKQAWIYTP